LIYTSRLVWASDGDQAFDDGSYELQFDLKDRVRLIALKSGAECGYDPHTIREAFLSVDEFYGSLRQWRGAFEVEWEIMPKLRVDRV